MSFPARQKGVLCCPANYNMLWILYEKKDVLLCGTNLPFFLLTYEWNIDIGTNNSAYL